MAITKATKVQRGQRIKQLRKPTRLSRRGFALKHGIPAGTLQYWEDGNFGGLSEEGAHRLTYAFAREGITVTVEWLLHGLGKEPDLDNFRYAAIKKKSVAAQEPSQPANNNPISAELRVFYKHNPGATHDIVPDNLMRPRFIQGEYVAGIQRLDPNLSPLVGKDCIIKTTAGKTLIRCLHQQEGDEEHILLTTLIPNQAENICLNKADILSIAAIIWARRV